MIFLAERNQNRPGIRAEFLAHAVDRHFEVGADAVHLVNESDARDVVLGRLPPDGFGLRLHPGDAVENRDRAVEHAQRTLDFRREIHVTGRVDDVDALLDAFENLVNALFLASATRLQVVAAEVIVMPRSRSCSIQSVTVVPSCTSPILWIMPV